MSGLVACRRRAVQVTRFDGGAEHVQAAARVADSRYMRMGDSQSVSLATIGA